MDEDMDIFAGTPEPTAALQADSTSVSASQPAAEQPSLPPVRPDAASLDQLSLESSPERAAPGLQQHSHGMTSSGSNNDAGIMALRNNDDGNQQPKHHAGVSGGFWADLQNAEASSVQIENQSTMSSMAANERGRSEARPSSMQSAEPSASGAGDAPGDVPCATRDRIPDTEPMQTDAAGMVSESAAGKLAECPSIHKAHQHMICPACTFQMHHIHHSVADLQHLGTTLQMQCYVKAAPCGGAESCAPWLVDSTLYQLLDLLPMSTYVLW